jgi:hypothetical protein
LKGLCFICLGWAFSVHADVFWRRPADLPGTWSRAYETPFESQGHEGTLTLYGTRDTLDQIESALRLQHGDSLLWMPGEIMAWAVAVRQGRIFRYLVQPRPNGEHWIALFDSRLAGAPEPGEEVTRHELRKLPAPVGGKPTFYSLDKGNQSAIEISEVPGSPEGALISLGQRLEDAGWTPSPVNTGGFRMYVKGKSVAFLGSHAGKDGITRVLRLHKPLGVQ